MVKTMLDGFGGDQRKRKWKEEAPRPEIECFHVNARFASDMKDMGSFRPGKALLLVRYILEAFWCRFRYGADVLYYCPAMPAKATLLRDIVVLLVLRPFFRRTYFFWHAAGLGEWLESGAVSQPVRWLAHRALRGADLSLSPAPLNVPDLEKFAPKVSGAVPYGIPDPCPEFNTTVLPLRKARMLERSNLKADANFQNQASNHISILYMALCAEEKGMLDAIEALSLLKKSEGAFHSPYSFTLIVAGKFLNPAEESKFRAKVEQHGLEREVSYAGFISGEEKNRLLTASDLFCFPTYFSGESAPIVILEAMAFGLPIVSTRWRNIPEFFPPNYPGIVDIKQPAQVASAILTVLKVDPVIEFRERFLREFTIEKHLRSLSSAFLAANGENKPAIPLVDGSSPAAPNRF